MKIEPNPHVAMNNAKEDVRQFEESKTKKVNFMPKQKPWGDAWLGQLEKEVEELRKRIEALEARDYTYPHMPIP